MSKSIHTPHGGACDFAPFWPGTPRARFMHIGVGPFHRREREEHVLDLADEAFGGSPQSLDAHLVDALPIPAFVCDRSGHLIRSNRAAHELIGSELTAGDDLAHVIHLLDSTGEPIPEGAGPIRLALASGQPVEHFVCLVRADDSRIPVTVAAWPLNDGQAAGILVTIQHTVAEGRNDTNRATLAAIVDSSDDAIVSKTLDGIITSWNAGAERVFGYTATEAIGKHISLIIPADRLPEESDVLKQLRRGEKIDHFETVRRAKDGRLIDISLTVSPIRAADGHIVGASKVARDITERNAANHIRETLTDVGATLAAKLDADKLVQAVTNAATQLTGADFGAFFYDDSTESEASRNVRVVAGAGKSAFTEVLNPDVRRRLSSAFRSDGIVRIDDVAIDESGEGRAVNAAADGRVPARSYLAVPVISRSREILGGLLLGHAKPGAFQTKHELLAAGIASWAAQALDNARLYKAAQDANTAKDEFLATLSHELRTPLNAMLGWTHLLRSGSLPADMRQRALEALERNGRAQAQLVDDLLDVSRIISGRLQLQVKDVELGAVIASAIDTVRPAATAKELNVRMRLPNAHVIVGGDADRLRQIFWNLLSNAVKFTAAHGTIEVELRTLYAGAEVTIRDTGIGIPRDFLSHVFERFRQADSSHSRKHGGLGLGLAIVRHLIEGHGGTVTVDSDGEGRGSTFTVRLPIKTVERLGSQETPAEPRRGTTLTGLQILVVDDERDAREFLAALLSMHGAEVAIAASAGEALGILARWRVDVLLADLGLPDRDGYSLIQAIRSLDKELGGLVPAVAVTAYAGLRERTRAFEAGYGWHVAKPVDPEQLLSIVSAAAATGAAKTTDV